MDSALAQHEQGNAAFRAGDLEGALRMYSGATAALNGVARCTTEVGGGPVVEALLHAACKTLCNRAAVYLKLGQLNDADADTSLVLAILSTSAVVDDALRCKAYLRRSSAREQCGRPQLALEDATAAAALLRRRTASQTAAQLVGEQVAAADAVGHALLQSALAARHRLDLALACARPAGGGVALGAASAADTAEMGGPRADDHADDRSSELLHSAHTLRLFMRDSPPPAVRVAKWFNLSFHLGNEFGLFRPQEQPLPLVLELSVHDGGAWRVETRTATPLLALAESLRGGGGAQEPHVASVPGHGKVELEARVVSRDSSGADLTAQVPTASLHIAAMPTWKRDGAKEVAPLAVMGVSTLPIAIAEEDVPLPAPLAALHDKAAALGVTSCRELPFSTHRILVAEAPGQLGIGGKVWDAAVALLSHLAPQQQESVGAGSSLVCGKRVLELGAGTGLVGLSCALLGASSVVVTDMADVVPLLALNAALNAQLLQDIGRPAGDDSARVTAAEMLWGSAADVEAHDAFELVVASDVVYDPAGYEPLLQTLNMLCDRIDPAAPPLLIVLAHRHRHPEDWRFFDKLYVQFDVEVTAQVALAGRGEAGAGKWGHDVKIMHITRKTTCQRTQVDPPDD